MHIVRGLHVLMLLINDDDGDDDNDDDNKVQCLVTTFPSNQVRDNPAANICRAVIAAFTRPPSVA